MANGAYHHLASVKDIPGQWIGHELNEDKVNEKVNEATSLDKKFVKKWEQDCTFLQGKMEEFKSKIDKNEMEHGMANGAYHHLASVKDIPGQWIGHELNEDKVNEKVSDKVHIQNIKDALEGHEDWGDSRLDPIEIFIENLPLGYDATEDQISNILDKAMGLRYENLKDFAANAISKDIEKAAKLLSKFQVNEGCGCNGSNESVSCVSYKGTEMVLETMIKDLWADELVEKSISAIDEIAPLIAVGARLAGQAALSMAADKLTKKEEGKVIEPKEMGKLITENCKLYSDDDDESHTADSYIKELNEGLLGMAAKGAKKSLSVGAALLK